MKSGKKPNLRQKKLLKEWKLNPENWLIFGYEPGQLTLIHRHTGRTRILAK